MWTLLARLSRSGPAVLACSVAVGLLVGGSALVYLETAGLPGEDARQESASHETRETTQETGGDTAGAQPGSSPDSHPGRAVRGKTRPEEEEEARTPRPQARNLEAEVRGIASDHPGEYGILLWQPGSGTRVAVGAGERFEAASLAKLPLLLALYREAAEGNLSLDDEITLRRGDVTGGTGALQDYPPGATLTLRRCSTFLIKESDNTAWAMLERRLGERRVRHELSNLETDSTRYGSGKNVTSPSDVLTMLESISEPDYTSAALSRKMLAAMTDTAFETWLPQGIPEDARMAHKIGVLDESFGDAGIVYPARGEGKPYYIVVMARDAGGEANARDAMREISLASYRGLVDPAAQPKSKPRKPGSGSRAE